MSSLINFRNNFQQSPILSIAKGNETTNTNGQTTEIKQFYPNTKTTLQFTNSPNINNTINASSTKLFEVKNNVTATHNSNTYTVGNQFKTLPNNSIKVINLTQLQQQQQQQQQKDQLTSSNNKIIQLNNTNINTFNRTQASSNNPINNTENRSDQTTTNSSTNSSNSNNTIQITKVVSSRGQFTSSGVTGVETNNLLYYNKGNNQLVPISQSSNNTFINRNPLTTTTSTIASNKTIPKFYTTSKMFTAHYVNNNSQNVTSHLSTLNSNINHYASQSNSINNIATSQNSNTVTINPRYTMNINPSTNNITNNGQQMNSHGNNVHHSNNNISSINNNNNNYLSNNYYQNTVEQDEEVVVEEEEELGHAETYASYMPTKCN